MLRSRTMRLATWLVALAAGCRGRSDLVEAELRLKDRQLREVSQERARLAELSDAYAMSLANGPPGACPPPGRGGNAINHVKDLQVGRGTGGLDEDKCDGDEGILVVLIPRDCDESAVKAPGAARIAALQITPEGLKIPLCNWEVTPAHLRRTWKTGLLSTGYFVALPFETVPCSEKLRIIAQFQTPDGAVFEAERDIQVRLGRPGPAGIPFSAPQPVPGGAPSLPPPTPLPGPLPAPTPVSMKSPAQLEQPERATNPAP